jgi:flavin reductase (DIM6/NTAB) family NADH-FMN oxidoreductase RutF
MMSRHNGDLVAHDPRPDMDGERQGKSLKRPSNFFLAFPKGARQRVASAGRMLGNDDKSPWGALIRNGWKPAAMFGYDKKRGRSMVRVSKKIDFPVGQVRRYLEPGPIVLVSSRWGGRTNIMTMGWHTVMEFTPSLVGCVISSGNYSHEMIRKSRECVINVPTTALTDTVVRIGNTSGADIDKFREFGLTAVDARDVKAPLIGECHANFECRLYDDALVKSYDFFIFEVVRAHVARSPKHPETLHYTGDGVFMVSGRIISRRSLFRPGML